MTKNLLYLEITIKGHNLKYLLGYLQNKKVDVYAFTESKEDAKIVIDYLDRRKFFAICKNMCYNIKSIKYKGVLSPLILAVKNIGLIIGICLFIFSAIYFNDYILKVDVGGNYYESEIISVSKDYGVDKFLKFSKALSLIFFIRYSALPSPSIKFIILLFLKSESPSSTNAPLITNKAFVKYSKSLAVSDCVWS